MSDLSPSLRKRPRADDEAESCTVHVVDALAAFTLWVISTGLAGAADTICASDCIRFLFGARAVA